MAKDHDVFSLRPRPGETNPRDVFKIYISQALWKTLHLNHGDLCQLEQAGEKVAVGTVAQATEAEPRVAQISHEFKDIYGLSFSEKYSLRKADRPIQQAVTVHVVEESSSNDVLDRSYWEGYLSLLLSTAKYVAPGLLLSNLQSAGERRSFRISRVFGSEVGTEPYVPSLFRFTVSSATKIDKEHAYDQPDERSLELSTEGTAGLENIIKQLNCRVRLYGYDWESDKLSVPYSRGIIIAGLPGSGKDILLSKISEAGWRKTYTIQYGAPQAEIKQQVSKAFLEAVKNEPSVILMSNLEEAIGSLNEYGNSPTAIEIANGFSAIERKRVLVVASTTSFAKLPTHLLIGSYFGQRFSIPAPDADARLEIMQNFLQQQMNAVLESDDLLAAISQRTQGYMGRDLRDLVGFAVDKALERRSNTFPQSRQQTSDAVSASAKTPVTAVWKESDLAVVTFEDLEAARRESAPTAIRDTRLQVTNVRWSDIGGQQETKETIEMLFEWPIKYPDRFRSLGLKPGKGLLLYGPPGCSKTMTAAALATEAKLNFFPIRGAEVLSKYVGESEANLRAIFTKAQSAAPSVIFFDEIDAIGGGSPADSGNSNDHGSGINLVTTLLNELDGIEALRGVFVLAATNRPWALNPALVRPGRFDRFIYVSLPNYETRLEILNIRLASMTHEPDIDVAYLAEKTEGCSGAEIAELCQLAGFAALKEQIHHEHSAVAGRHFAPALKNLRRDTSKEMVRRYKEFAARGKPLVERKKAVGKLAQGIGGDLDLSRE